eukprot:17281_1
MQSCTVYPPKLITIYSLWKCNNYLSMNAYFVNSDPIQLQQLMHNNVIHSTQCDIQSLLVNNTESNVITSLICDFDLTSMPTTQPTVPTPSPVTNYPTASPTTLNKYTCAVTKQFIPNWYHYNLCYSVFMDLSTRDANVDFTETLFYSTYQPQDERYDFYIKYTAVNGNCLDATLSITRRYRREFSLYSAQEPWEELSRCLDDPYPRGASCTSYFECLSDYPLGDIFNGEEYTVHLLGRSRSNSCSYAYDHRDYMDANLTIHCAQVTQPTLQPTMKPSVAPTATVPMMWTEFDNYTCSDLSSPMQVLYNISLSQCKLHCVSVYPSITCTAIVWYEYIKPTGTDTPRCYLFNRSCALVSETTKPVTVAFPYYDEQSDMECVDYPILWEDRFHDNCDAYSQYNWCNATGLLTAMDACCDCNGGLVSYNQRYLLEAVWKPKLQSITTHHDFLCQTLNFSSSLLAEKTREINLYSPQWNVPQFGGLCQYFHTALHRRFKTLSYFDCMKALYFYNVTICNDTDYNNLIPFLIDVDGDHIYINNHYIYSSAFTNALSETTHLTFARQCDFSSLLNVANKTSIIAAVTCEISIDPTSNPTTDPTLYPTKHPSVDPTAIPTKVPTTANPTDVGDTKNPTQRPTKPPTAKGYTYKPTKTPTAYIAGAFPGYSLFVRGFNIFTAESSGNAILDVYYLSNIETWTDEGATCSYSSLEFDSSFASYATYSKSDSESISVGFSAAKFGGGGSLSRERTETKQYSASSQTYIYTMNLECISSHSSIVSYDELYWSSNFIKTLKTLPTSVPTSLNMDDRDIMDEYIAFWDAFGTHVMRSGKLGGVIKGAITVDKCAAQQSYSDTTAYKTCLNAQYKGVEVEGCHQESDSSVNSNSAASSITNQRIVVKGGDNSQFMTIFNSFGNKQNDFQNWISDLGNAPDIVGGNAEEIHAVIKQTIDLGEHQLNNNTDYMDDDTWLSIASALQSAFDVYSTYLSNNDATFGDSECILDCGEGEVDVAECTCDECGSTSKCCGLLADRANCFTCLYIYIIMHLSLIFLL